MDYALPIQRVHCSADDNSVKSHIIYLKNSLSVVNAFFKHCKENERTAGAQLFAGVYTQGNSRFLRKENRGTLSKDTLLC